MRKALCAILLRMATATYETAQRLRQDYEPARKRLEAVLAKLSDELMTAPTLEGGWSVKDVLAHIAFWDDRLVYAVHPPSGARNPLAPPQIEDIPYGPEWLEAVNTRVYRLNHERPLDEVRRDFEQAYTRLQDTVRGASDHDLLDPDGLTRRWGFPAMEMFDGIREHYAEHAEALEHALRNQS